MGKGLQSYDVDAVPTSRHRSRLSMRGRLATTGLAEPGRSALWKLTSPCRGAALQSVAERPQGQPVEPDPAHTGVGKRAMTSSRATPPRIPSDRLSTRKTALGAAVSGKVLPGKVLPDKVLPGAALPGDMLGRYAAPVAVVLLLAAWEAAVLLADVPGYILPPPSRILTTLAMRADVILPQAGTTLWEI